MGLTDAEFWKLTPEEFYALQQKWYEDQQRCDLRTGIIAALIGNLFLKKGKKPFRPVDFMAFKGDYKQVDTPKHMPWEKQLEKIQQINQLFGGKDLRLQTKTKV